MAIIVDGVAQQPREGGVCFIGKIASHAAEMGDLTNSGQAG
jgi:hypothetical protein